MTSWTKGTAQMIGKSQTAGSGNDWGDGEFAKLCHRFLDQGRQGFLNICIVPFIIREQQILLLIKNSNFYSGRTDINSKSM